MQLTDYQKDKMYEYGIPGHMHYGLRLYYEKRVPPGGFLTAVLEGDLFAALGRADDKNINALKAYGLWLYNQAPAGSYGSKEAVKRWLEGGHELQKEDAA